MYVKLKYLNYRLLSILSEKYAYYHYTIAIRKKSLACLTAAKYMKTVRYPAPWACISTFFSLLESISISCLENRKCLSCPNPWEHPLLPGQSLGVKLWNRTLAGAWRRASSSSTGTCPGSARWSRGTMRASVSSWMSGETGLSPAGRILSDTQPQGDHITEWELNKHTLTYINTARWFWN